MEIKLVPLSSIKPYFNNPRDNEKAIAPTKESIKKYGFVKPIICDKDGVIIAGHTRYIASFQLGLKEVPVIFSDMDSEKAKQFRIADNKLAEKSIFDEDKLIRELKEMSSPNDMQSFFFEDIDSMINFDASSFGNFTYDGYDDVNQSSGGYSYEEDNEDNAYVMGLPVGGDSEEEDDEVVDSEKSEDTSNTPRLYEPYFKDGKKVMNIVCPYCNQIEIVEL
jgi:hypothetical protein